MPSLAVECFNKQQVTPGNPRFGGTLIIWVVKNIAIHVNLKF